MSISFFGRFTLIAVTFCSCSKQEPEPASVGPAAAPAAAAPVAAPAPAPYSPTEYDEKTLCSENGLLLTRFSYKDLQQGGYCKRCKPFDETACEMDWPTSDVWSCRNYDRMRNAIFASYGYVFSKDEWKNEFSSKNWYRPDPSFTEGRLSAVAKDNVAYLKKAAAEKTGCMD